MERTPDLPYSRHFRKNVTKKEPTPESVETYEMEQFPEPPKLQRSNAYVRESNEPSATGDESRDGGGKESTEDPIETIPESGDDTVTDDDDVSETDGTEEESEDGGEESEYSSEEDEKDEEEQKESTENGSLRKRRRHKMSKTDVEDTVRRYLNTRYLLSKKKDLLGDNFFV